MRLALLLLLTSPVHALTRLAVMEQWPTSNNTIFVDTGNARLDIATQTYSGKVANVGLYTTSNVVVGSCVIYSTGSSTCSGGGGGGSTTFVYVSSVGYANNSSPLTATCGAGTAIAITCYNASFNTATTNFNGTTSGTCVFTNNMAAISTTTVVCATP